MTFAWSKTVEDGARAICKRATGSEDKWEDYVSTAVHVNLTMMQPKPKPESGHYKLVESTGEPYRAGTEYGEWQWWRPIDTAPKNGTFILLSGGKPDPNHWGYWGDEPLPSMVVAQYYNDSWQMCRYDTDCASVHYEKPTHWMPLPEPPDDD